MVIFIIFLLALLLIWGVPGGPLLAQQQIGEKSINDKIERPQKKQLGKQMGRNPFLLPPGVYPLSKGGGSSGSKEGSSQPAKKSPETELPSFKVRAILISDHIRLATIGRWIVTVGDSIDDEKVLGIKKDRVILGKVSKKRTLLLDQSPLKLITEEK